MYNSSVRNKMASITTALLLVSALQSFFIASTNGIIIKNLELGLGISTKCPPLKVLCPCGLEQQKVKIILEQCTYFHRLKTKCKPCNDKTPEKVCSRYLWCSKCNLDGGDGCLQCPSDRYGVWCEQTCVCYNGGYCNQNGNCVCSEEYEGSQCERLKGCPPPSPVTTPLRAHYHPPHKPRNITYSCEPNYHLRGNSINLCLSNSRWSTIHPECLPKCPLLSAPAYGSLTFDGSDLVEGIIAKVTCDPDHRLTGEKSLKCLATGKWSSDLPRCEELAFCTDPGYVRYAKRTIPNNTLRNGETFYQDTTIRFECKQGFQQMGTSHIVCLDTGEWSHEKPTCIKASAIIPDCETVGSDVVAEVGVPVRILCPPECTNEDSTLWGTSIYRIDSAVCPAAVHAGKITNSGGLVAIINNGDYTSFAGSYINNIQSQSFEDSDQSFRFDKLPSLIRSKDKEGECPEGLVKLEDICVIISTYPRTEAAAEATCKNFGLDLIWPPSEDDQNRLLLLLHGKGINQLWTGTILEPVIEPILESNKTSEEITNTTSMESFSVPSEPKCETMEISSLEFVPKNKECDLNLHYVCSYSPSTTNLASCVDPGVIINGETKHVGKIRDTFYVGSSIEYTCKSLHYLKGVSKISCRGNGTWTDEKPTCILVNTCEEQLVPIGGYVNYLPPLNSAVAERIAISRSGNPGFRMARLPVGLDAMPGPDAVPVTTMPGPEMNIELPPGRHRVGTRAMYDCESRYYRLVGSKARRCQEKGQWSGRPPTCMPVCGRSDSPRTPFIVNGNATDIGQWPWQAGLARYIPDYNRWFLLCGGSLLSERWIITAAHCVTYAGTTLVIDPDKFRVYLGKYHRSDSKDDEYVQTRTIHEIHIHPDYDPGIFEADIALIQLQTPVQLNSRVQPVCLPSEQSTQANLQPGTKGVVTGWGMNENESYSETLQQAVLPVVSNEECERGYVESELPLSVTENMFCAGFKQGRNDACSGDSGGPMVFADDSAKQRRWVLEGIVSWGSPNGCGNENQYGGYTTVSQFLNWIHLFF